MPEEMFVALAAALKPMNTTKEVARATGFSEGTLGRWRLEKIGPGFVATGHVVRYPRESVLAFCREHYVTTVPVATTKQFETV